MSPVLITTFGFSGSPTMASARLPTGPTNRYFSFRKRIRARLSLRPHGHRENDCSSNRRGRQTDRIPHSIVMAHIWPPETDEIYHESVHFVPKRVQEVVGR